LTHRWGTIVTIRDGTWKLAVLTIDDETLYRDDRLVESLKVGKGTSSSAKGPGQQGAPAKDAATGASRPTSRPAAEVPVPPAGRYVLRSVSRSLQEGPMAYFADKESGKKLYLHTGDMVGTWQITEISFEYKRVVLKDVAGDETVTLQLPARTP
jgi:hypothetical protein